MNRPKYTPPTLMTVSGGGSGNVSGEGSGQGSHGPEGITYEEWWVEIAWEGENPDADYNGDGSVDVNDYNYYIDNELWNG